MPKANNITPEIMARYLKTLGYEEDIKGGHYHFRKKGALRPITFQTHVDPIPRMIIGTIVRNLGITKKKLEEEISRM